MRFSGFVIPVLSCVYRFDQEKKKTISKWQKMNMPTHASR